ncbi:MAG: hypothetical protein ACE5F2_02515 [Candidatus Paceibacteria bacterium]
MVFCPNCYENSELKLKKVVKNGAQIKKMYEKEDRKEFYIGCDIKSIPDDKVVSFTKCLGCGTDNLRGILRFKYPILFERKVDTESMSTCMGNSCHSSRCVDCTPEYGCLNYEHLRAYGQNHCGSCTFSSQCDQRQFFAEMEEKRCEHCGHSPYDL